MAPIRHILVFFFLVYLSISVFSQSNLCPPVNAGNDTIICSQTAVQLLASTGYMSYEWSPSTGLNNPYIQNPVASISGNITYTVTAVTSDTNLVTNGDFSQGNIGFTNDYSYSINYSPCNYYVGTTFFNSSFAITDHSPSVDDMFMSIDGCTFQSVLWEQTITAIPSNADFDFEFWATRAGANQPIFAIYYIGNITGVEIIDTLYGVVPMGPAAVWDQYTVPSWNSGNNTSVTIRIVCLTNMVMGVDFAMDDISFTTQSCSSVDSVSIFYVHVPPPTMPADTIVCQHNIFPALQASGQNIQWYSSPSVSLGNTAPVPNTDVATSTTYYCSQTIQGCESDLDSMTIDILEIPYFDLGPSFTVCVGDEIKIGPNDDSPWTYQWMDAVQATPLVIADDEDKTYILTGENFCGSYTDSIRINRDECLCYFYYPNAFTPDGDTHNETFKPVYDCRLEEYDMRIFNRWGELIFESRNPDEGWAGLYNNHPAEQGIYTVQINYAALHGTKKIYKSAIDKLTLVK